MALETTALAGGDGTRAKGEPVDAVGDLCEL